MGARPSPTDREPRRLRRLRRYGLLAEMTVSVIATVLGIGLTFGIDGCVERRRQQEEMRKSMLQAVDNLGERFDDARKWVDRISAQNQAYREADSLYQAGAEVPDSLCEKVRYTLPYIKISAFDHEFEKIFRGSYQLWQLQNRSDSLAYYIGQCYDGLNMVETTCQALTEGMLEQIGAVNAVKGFHRLPPREWTLALLGDPQFQYYMSVRRVKGAVAAGILEAATADYEANVIPRSERLR